MEPPAADPNAEVLGRAQAFMKALHAWVQRNRIYPQWAKQAPALAEAALQALLTLLQAAPQACFAVESPGLRVNGTPLDSLRGGEVVWEFASLLSERLVASVAFQLGASSRELEVFAQEMSAPFDRYKAPPDHWERLLKREGVSHISVVQRRHASYDEGESVVLLRGDLVGDRPLDGDEMVLAQPVLHDLHAAAVLLRAQPPEDPVLGEQMRTAADGLVSLLSRARVITLAAEGEGLTLNGQPLAGETARFFAADLARKGFRSLTLKDGITGAEVCALVSVLAVPPDDPAARQHIEQILHSNAVRRFVFARADAPRRREPAPAQPLPEAVFTEMEEQGTRTLLSALENALINGPPEQFVSEKKQLEFARLVEHPLPHIRDRLLALARKALREELADDPLERFAVNMRGALKSRILIEADPEVQRSLAETLRAWLATAVQIGKAAMAAELIRSAVKPALDSAHVSREFKTALTAKIRSLGAELSKALLTMLIDGPPEARETATVAIGVIGPVMIAKVLYLATSESPEIRRAAARSLGAIGGTGQMDLAKLVTPQAPAETARRALEVLDLAGASYVATPILSGLAHPDPAVREAAMGVVERTEPGIAARILHELMAGQNRELRLRAIQAAARRKSAEIRDDVLRLLASTEDEEFARTCCLYFQAVPTPAAAESLKRVFEMRPRAFGLVKGWSEQTRAAAVAAAMPISMAAAAQQILAAAQKDPSRAVREAATLKFPS